MRLMIIQSCAACLPCSARARSIEFEDSMASVPNSRVVNDLRSFERQIYECSGDHELTRAGTRRHLQVTGGQTAPKARAREETGEREDGSDQKRERAMRMCGWCGCCECDCARESLAISCVDKYKGRGSGLTAESRPCLPVDRHWRLFSCSSCSSWQPRQRQRQQRQR